MAGYQPWPSNGRAEFLPDQVTSWWGDAWFFAAWIVVAGYAAAVGYLIFPTAGLAVVGVVPVCAAIVGGVLGSRRRLHTVWGVALIPVAAVTGVAIGAHHFVQGQECSTSATSVAPAVGQPMRETMSTTCTINHAPHIFASLEPYLLSCVVMLLVAAALAVAFGRRARRSDLA